MLERLNRLVREVYDHELKEKELEKRKNEAQLRALQYQINPHFLYNTFASMKFLVKLDQKDEAIRMITALSRLFHRAVHAEQVIPVQDEVEYAKAYVVIEQMRYRDKLQVEWDIDDGLRGFLTLKFILQPIVENAILHGIRAHDRAGLIIISGDLCDDSRIRFTVSDNGVGMEPGVLENLRAAIGGVREGRGVGLANVQERIHLNFGGDYGISITSDPGKGTRVLLEVPAIPVGAREVADAQTPPGG